MSIENDLRAIIENRYGSLYAFASASGMPYATLVSMFKRGFMNSSVANIIRICETLDISADGLATGAIIPASLPRQSANGPEELQLIRLYRAADERARQDAMIILGSHSMEK